MALVDRLQKECQYDPMAESGVDDLIAYKDALEDLVHKVDMAALANSASPSAQRLHAEEGWVHLSAADVCGELFCLGFGKTDEEAA